MALEDDVKALRKFLEEKIMSFHSLQIEHMYLTRILDSWERQRKALEDYVKSQAILIEVGKATRCKVYLQAREALGEK